jgi:hypothetical protein
MNAPGGSNKKATVGGSEQSVFAGLYPTTFSSYYNRSIPRPATKIAGSYRIVFIGDSMSYGQGVPAGESMPDRVGALLNEAAPSLLVETFNLGKPGACLFHNLSRSITTGLDLCPDLLILVLCENDAAMLRGQSPVLESVGQTWLDFRSTMVSALREFNSQILRCPELHPIVVYFSRRRQMGAVCIPEVLREICEETNLPFFDTSHALAGYDPTLLIVSDADEHLNSFAHNVAGQNISRFILDGRYLPEFSGFEDPSWISQFEDLPDRRIMAGVGSFLAQLQSRLDLQQKWESRRNRKRADAQAEYERVRNSIAENEKREVLGLALWELSRRAEINCAQWERYLLELEKVLYECSALSFALDHYAKTGRAGQDLLEIPSLGRFERSLCDRQFSDISTANINATLQTILGAVQSRLERLKTFYQTVLRYRPAFDRPETDQLLGYWGKLHGLHLEMQAALRQILNCLQLLVTRKVPNEIQILTLYLNERAQYLERCLHEAFSHFPADFLENADTSIICSTRMRLELQISAPPCGTQRLNPWYLELSANGICPFYLGYYIHCQNVLRDDKPHLYLADIPFFLSGEIEIRLEGPGIGEAWQNCRQARFVSSILRVPGLKPLDIHQAFRRTALKSEFAEFTYGLISLWEQLNGRAGKEHGE